MTSIKIKFRESKISKQKGRCFIQLIHKRKMKTIATGLNLSTKEWDSLKEHVVTAKATPQRYKELMFIQEQLDRTVTILNEIVMRLNRMETYVTADCIVQSYREIHFTRSYFAIVEERIRHMEENGQKKTASNYRSTLKIFQKFRNDRDVVPEQLNGSLMKEFELYLKSNGNSLNTVSFYMRNLQAAYNFAVEKKWILRNAYPFKGGFTGEERTAKRAVEIEVIKELDNLNLAGRPALELARDLFMFSLYTRGMAFIDIAHLNKKNVKGQLLEYKRHKTKQQIQVSLPDRGMEIIMRYACIMDDSDYLFPILYHPRRGKRSSYDSSLRLYNQRLKEISDILGLSQPLTSHVSRHSWATLAKKLGVATYIISDAMGHTSENTTRIYLDSINNSVLDEANHTVISAIYE